MNQELASFISFVSGDETTGRPYAPRPPARPEPGPAPVLALPYRAPPLSTPGRVLFGATMVRVDGESGVRSEVPCLVRQGDRDLARSARLGRSFWVYAYRWRGDGVAHYRETLYTPGARPAASTRPARESAMEDRAESERARMRDEYGSIGAPDDDGAIVWASAQGRTAIAIGPDGIGVFCYRPNAWVGITRWEDHAGFDVTTGLSRSGYDREGYSSDGWDRSGYDRAGYDDLGYDRFGVNRAGEHRPSCECQECGRISGYHEESRDWDIGAFESAGHILFGVENELNTSGSAARKRVARLAPKGDWRIITERDGSLGEYGVECVGPPLPLAWYRPRRTEHAGNPWAAFLPAIEAACGASGEEPGSSRTYGMHVNISRAPIVAYDLAKGAHWEKRIVDTFNDAKSLVQHVAGRNSTYYAAFHGRNPGRYEVNGTKYRACNVRSHVLEIRIFKASADPARLRANVQFCAAVLSWCKRGNRAKNDPDSVRLAEWIMAHPRNYPDLIPHVRRWLSARLTGVPAPI